MARELGGNELPLFGRTKMIQRRAARDRQQPVDDRSVAIDPVNVLERLHERLLREVLRILALARHLINKVEHATMVDMYDLLERADVSGRRGSEHLYVVA